MIQIKKNFKNWETNEYLIESIIDDILWETIIDNKSFTTWKVPKTSTWGGRGRRLRRTDSARNCFILLLLIVKVPYSAKLKQCQQN